MRVIAMLRERSFPLKSKRKVVYELPATRPTNVGFTAFPQPIAFRLYTYWLENRLRMGGKGPSDLPPTTTTAHLLHTKDDARYVVGFMEKSVGNGWIVRLLGK